MFLWRNKPTYLSICIYTYIYTIMVVCLCNFQDRTYYYVFTKLPVRCVCSTDSL